MSAHRQRWLRHWSLSWGLLLRSGALQATRSVLYGVGVYDVPTIFAVIMLLASVTLIATTVFTLRIGGIDPAKTLREECRDRAVFRKIRRITRAILKSTDLDFHDRGPG